MNITLIPPGHVCDVLPRILGYVSKAREWSYDRYTVDDMVAGLFKPGVMLWIVFDDDNHIHGYLATEIREFPQARHFIVLHCGGQDGSLDACVGMVFDTFERYARESGCDGLEIIGRHAWWKHIRERGFSQPQRQYFKDLKGA